MAWLGNWQYRHKITIDATKIVSNLTHFPVRVHLSSYSGSGGDNVTDIFDEIGGNKYKIAFTKSDGETQLYGEIENWDSVNKVADIWVSSPELVLDSTTDTEIYIYFDISQPDNTDYIGLIGSPAGQAVWDDNFVLVHHMKDDTPSTIKDSTSIGNNGEKKGIDEPMEIDGKVGKSQDFDGVDDFITIPSSSSIQFVDTFSVFMWIKTDSATSGRIISKNDSYFVNYGGSSGYISLAVVHHLGEEHISTNYTNYNNNKWHFFAGIVDHGFIRLYTDGEFNSYVQTLYAYADVNNNPLIINASKAIKVNLDEISFSNIARSAAWIKATYNSVNDTLIKDYAPKETSIYNTTYYLSLSSTLGPYGEQLEKSSFSLSANLEPNRWKKDTTHSQIWIKEETHNEIYKS